MSKKIAWDTVFDDFKKRHAKMFVRGTTYKPAGFLTIHITIPDDGLYEYEFMKRRLTCLEKFESRIERIRREEAERERLRKEQLLEDLRTKRAKVEAKQSRDSRVRDFLKDAERTMRRIGMSQKELAQNSDISETAICRYFSGTQLPRDAVVYRIADALGLDPYI